MNRYPSADHLARAAQLARELVAALRDLPAKVDIMSSWQGMAVYRVAEAATALELHQNPQRHAFGSNERSRKASLGWGSAVWMAEARLQEAFDRFLTHAGLQDPWKPRAYGSGGSGRLKADGTVEPFPPDPLWSGVPDELTAELEIATNQLAGHVKAALGPEESPRPNAPRLLIDLASQSIIVDGATYPGLDPDAVRVVKAIADAGGRKVKGPTLEQQLTLVRIDRVLSKLPRTLFDSKGREGIVRSDNTGYWITLPLRPEEVGG